MPPAGVRPSTSAAELVLRHDARVVHRRDTLTG